MNPDPEVRAALDVGGRIDAVPMILEVLCRSTGMGFAAMARVTEERWISSSTRDRLFHPFSRGAVRPNQQGLGLGLYISSEIARAHGGVLDVASTSDETRFTFQMPIGGSAP